MIARYHIITTDIESETMESIIAKNDNSYSSNSTKDRDRRIAYGRLSLFIRETPQIYSFGRVIYSNVGDHTIPELNRS